MKGTLRVTPEKMMVSAVAFASTATDIKRITDQMLNIVKSLNSIWEGNLSTLIIRKFCSLDNDMKRMYRMVLEHATDLREMAENYKKAEDFNHSLSNALPTGLLSSRLGTLSRQSSVLNVDGKYGQADAENPGVYPNKESFGGKASVVQGAIQGGMVVPILSNGVTAEGSLSGNLLGGSYGTTGGIEYKTKVDETTGEKSFDSLGINYGIKGEVHAAAGNAEGRFGFVSGSADATVGKVSAMGAIGATLFEKGKLSPQISASANVKATAVEGNASVSAGTDNNNVHAKAAGDLLSAKAEIKGGAGVITYEDDEGNSKAGIGVQAEAGAEAYMATGKLQGGIKIFNIDIDVGVTGHVGGASAKAGGRITTGGVGASIDLGLLLGLGLDISIDWSDFKFSW